MNGYIEGSVVQDALELRAKLNDSGQAASYLGALPAEAKVGKVVIRHSSATARTKAFVAFASLDVQFRARNTVYTRHFDKTGAERRLPQEELLRGVRGDTRP
jgi:hypothetical protein